MGCNDCNEGRLKVVERCWLMEAAEYETDTEEVGEMNPTLPSPSAKNI